MLKRGAKVSYHDPYVQSLYVGGDVFLKETVTLLSQPLTEASLKQADCVIIVTGHHVIDYNFVVKTAPAVVDCCDATASISQRKNVTRLGAGS